MLRIFLWCILVFDIVNLVVQVAIAFTVGDNLIHLILAPVWVGLVAYLLRLEY